MSVVTVALLLVASARADVIWNQEETEAAGFVWRGNSSAVSSHELLQVSKEPMTAEWNWCAHPDGKSYCTMSRNQHLPQYCGSCWAHGAVSALADRVKIARGAAGADVNLAVQHILNCRGGGSCHGGSVDGPYQWLHRLSRTGRGLSYESSLPYMACSSESTEGLCAAAGADQWTCDPINVARTCSTFSKQGGKCVAIEPYPQVTIDDYGSIRGVDAMQKEIKERGPISCGVDAQPMLNYTSGVFTKRGIAVDHVVSVVGWGLDPDAGSYWIVRNSWGEFWGEMGFIRLAFGSLHIESQCAWATPATYTANERNNQVHCFEGGENCDADDVNKKTTNAPVM